MTIPHNEYRPISCDFHDILESLATLHQQTHVRFLSEDGLLQHRCATIVDVFSKDGVEYLAISTGETLRLDQLVAVGKSKVADF